MAWTRESKTNPIIDGTLGTLTTWDGTTFIWKNITTYWRRTWTKEARLSAGWTKES